MKFNSIFNFLYISGFLTLILGCYASDQTLVPKPPYEPTSIQEGYNIKFEPKVDIVFVVDDSGSMYTHQRNLSTNLGLFTGAMELNKFLDYHIGVMSTSTDSWSWSSTVPGKLQGTPHFVTRETPQGLMTLQRNIEALGTSGSATERMFDPLYAGLVRDRDKINPGFLRPEAFLVVILVTDAEDQSALISGSKVYNELLRLKSGDEKKLLGYSVLAYPNFFNDRCSQDGWEDPTEVVKFMSLFSNVYNSRISGTSNTSSTGALQPTNIFSLCDNSYGQKLSNIGEDIRYRVSQVLPLPRLPVRGTIRLKYGSNYVDPKWYKYDPTTQSLILHPDIELIEEEGAQFSVEMDLSNPDETIGAPPPGEL
ncbi:MAG: hypothetical protein M9899_09825 [Bdellovibrionaceae bacterium]|nr:hypothetical protein [Pseudobdellovibrionaceae bacterium]